MAARLVPIAILGFAAFGAAVLFGGPAAAQGNLPASAKILLRYDADKDGVITTAELDAGIAKDFAEADTDGDGMISRAEANNENDRRLERDGGEAAPVRDWNFDGHIDIAEFGNAARAYFVLLDRTKRGQITMNDLRNSAIPQQQTKPSLAQSSPMSDPKYNPGDTAGRGATGF